MLSGPASRRKIPETICYASCWLQNDTKQWEVSCKLSNYHTIYSHEKLWTTLWNQNINLYLGKRSKDSEGNDASCGTFTARMNWNNNFDSIICWRGKATLVICSSMHLFQSIHQHEWHLLPTIHIIIFVLTARVVQNLGRQHSLLNFCGIFFLQEI